MAGEYAVLYGGTAVLFAINRRAVAQTTFELPPPSPFLQALQDIIHQTYGPQSPMYEIAQQIVVDSSALCSPQAVKYGLGSSAAVTVAATTLCLATVCPPTHANVHKIAHAAHGRAQQQRGIAGSGADIAAATYGGVLAVSPRANNDPVTVQTLPVPGQLSWLAVWTGTPADTIPLVESVERMRKRTPRVHEQICRALADVATNLTDYLRNTADATQKIIASIDKGAQLLDSLGQACDRELVPASHHTIRRLASQYGGAAKPTGAGGGDIAFAAFPTPSQAERFRAAAHAKGFEVLDLQISPTGTLSTTLHGHK